MRDEYDFRGGVRGKYFQSYISTLGTTSNSTSYTIQFNDNVIEPRDWLPPGSQASWKRGIWA
jgi:hypothetical protein